MASPAASPSASHLDHGLGGVKSRAIKAVGSSLLRQPPTSGSWTGEVALLSLNFSVYKMDISRVSFLELWES